MDTQNESKRPGTNATCSSSDPLAGAEEQKRRATNQRPTWCADIPSPGRRRSLWSRKLACFDPGSWKPDGVRPAQQLQAASTSPQAFSLPVSGGLNPGPSAGERPAPLGQSSEDVTSVTQGATAVITADSSTEEKSEEDDPTTSDTRS